MRIKRYKKQYTTKLLFAIIEASKKYINQKETSMNIQTTTCCNAVVSDEREQEQIELDELLGIEHKNDYGIYECPECGEDSSVKLDSF